MKKQNKRVVKLDNITESVRENNVQISFRRERKKIRHFAPEKSHFSLVL